MLHIPKTGGTALHSALGAIPDGTFRLHGHLIRLDDIPRGEKVIFSIRDPISRFVSGFNSRLRKAQPRGYIEWTPVQQEGFRLFPTPNALAEALSDPDLEMRRWATRLIRDMFHTAVPLSYWLDSIEYLQARSSDIPCILYQPELGADFEVLKDLLGLPADLSLPSDPLETHETPDGFDTHLSERAIGNLQAWYRGDFVFFEAAQRLRAEKRGAATIGPILSMQVAGGS